MNLEQIFTYRKPFGNQPTRYISLREKAKEFAILITDCCPDSRERSLAITYLQQSVMWAIASIAIREEDTSGK